MVTICVSHKFLRQVYNVLGEFMNNKYCIRVLKTKIAVNSSFCKFNNTETDYISDILNLQKKYRKMNFKNRGEI